MTPSFSVKPNKRYRYYMSRPDRLCDEDAKPVRVPAGDLERIVIDRLGALLLDRPALLDLLGPSAPARGTENAFNNASRAAVSLASDDLTKTRKVLRDLVPKVEIREGSMHIEICRASVLGLGAVIGPARHRLDVPCQLFRRAREVRLTIPGPPTVGRRDPGLIKLVIRAWEARRAFEGARSRSVLDVAKAHGMHPDYFATLVKLGYLAPLIVNDILHGRQPPTLTRQKLARIRNLPASWPEQAEMMSRL